MGNALRMIPEPELRQNCNRLTSRDLEDRLLASTPAIDNAVSRTVSLINATERQHLLQSAPIFRNLSSSERCEIGSLAGELRVIPEKWFLSIPSESVVSGWVGDGGGNETFTGDYKKATN